MKYAIVIGTKAEFIKTFPIMLEFQNRSIEYLFIHTGQHSLGDLIEKFKTKSPDIIINARDGFKGDTGGAFKWGLDTLPKLTSYLKKAHDIEYVLVHGDTISCTLGAIASKLAGKKVCHVEAGLRSGNIRSPWPEELMRIITDNISDIKFAPSEKSAARLRGKVFNVGNTSFDALNYALDLKNYPVKVGPIGQYCVVSIHRHETIKSKTKMEKIIKNLSYCQLPVLWFIHDNTKSKLREYGLMPKISKNISLIPPLEYSQFVHILNCAKFVIGDGGSLAEELSYLNIPYICFRENTEREELLDRPDQKLVGFDEEAVKLAIMEYSLPLKNYYIQSAYYNGDSPSKQILDILINLSAQ